MARPARTAAGAAEGRARGSSSVRPGRARVLRGLFLAAGFSVVNLVGALFALAALGVLGD